MIKKRLLEFNQNINKTLGTFDNNNKPFKEHGQQVKQAKTKVIDSRCPPLESTNGIALDLTDLAKEHHQIIKDINNFMEVYDFLQAQINQISKDKVSLIDDASIDDIIDNQRSIKSEWLEKLKQAEIQEDSEIQVFKDKHRTMLELQTKVNIHDVMMSSYENQLLRKEIELKQLKHKVDMYCQGQDEQKQTILQTIMTLQNIINQLKHQVKKSILSIQSEIKIKRNKEASLPLLHERVPSYLTVMRHIELKAPDRKSLNMINLFNHYNLLESLINENSKCNPIRNISSIMLAIDSIDYKLSNLNDYSSHLYNIACAWKQVIRSFTMTYIKQGLIKTLNNEGISHDLQPAKLLSDTSTEGITWIIGYQGIANRAVLKYDTKKKEQSVPPNPPNQPAPAAPIEYAIDSSNNLLHEIIVGFQLNKIANKTPNFMYTYGGFSCSVPLSTNPQPSGQTSGENSYSFDNLCDMSYSKNLSLVMINQLCNQPQSFIDFIKNDRSFVDTDIYQLWCQVVCALAIAYNEFKFIHGDLHGKNVMVTKLPTPQDITYVIQDKDLKVKYTIVLKQCKYIARIIDYGHSVMYINGKRYFSLSYNRDRNDHIKYSSYNIENALINENDFYPQFLDMLRLMSYLFTSSNTTTTRINNLVLFQYSVHGSIKRNDGYKLFSDYRKLMCVTDSSGQSKPFCGYINWNAYWTELNYSFHTGGLTSISNKPIKNLAQAAKVYFELLLGGTVTLSTI